ncbi:MAG: hypothetical protein ABFC63_10535 [Thermoguttaceae bacterium]
MESRTGVIGLDELRRRVARLETRRQSGREKRLSSGCEVLDQLLPEKGFRRGTLVEWLAGDEGGGTVALSLLAAREACEKSAGPLAVLDWRGDFYPPAAIRLGISTEQLLLVRPQDVADHDWAADQLLRSVAVAAVLIWPRTSDVRTLRRWQLAAEQGGTLGLLLRPAAVRSEPSWADVRLLVEPLPGIACEGPCLRITVLRCRGATAGQSVEVELDDETNRVRSLERRLHVASGQ